MPRTQVKLAIYFTCDPNPHNQGHVLPGRHLPILAPQRSASGWPDGQFAARSAELRLFP